MKMIVRRKFIACLFRDGERTAIHNINLRLPFFRKAFRAYEESWDRRFRLLCCCVERKGRNKVNNHSEVTLSLTKWARAWQNQQNDLCDQRRPRSESLLSAWRNFRSEASHWEHSKDFDQTGQISRLIWVFAGCTSFCWFYRVASQMSHVMRKSVYAICELRRRRSACAFVQSDQRLCCSLPR